MWVRERERERETERERESESMGACLKRVFITKQKAFEKEIERNRVETETRLKLRHPGVFFSKFRFLYLKGSKFIWLSS